MDKLSYEVLESMLADAHKLVPIGTIWQHYKGPQYEVKDIVITEETNECAVVYTPLLHRSTPFVRPLAIWLETVAWNNETPPRFTRITA